MNGLEAATNGRGLWRIRAARRSDLQAFEDRQEKSLPAERTNSGERPRGRSQVLRKRREIVTSLCVLVTYRGASSDITHVRAFWFRGVPLRESPGSCAEKDPLLRG